MDRLPIDQVMPEILAALERAGRVVIQAPTGAGKTTRVPAAVATELLPPEQAVLVLEPRRIAARAAARRVAREHGCEVGDWVGYQVRFDSRVSERTRVVYMTPGLLIRRLQDDPFLEGVGAIVFDEAHERGLDADIALALVRQVREDAREDLLIAVMSATLDTEIFAGFLARCPTVMSSGRAYPVHVSYQQRDVLPSARDLPERVASGVLTMLDEADGDVLAFLPGRRTIEATISLLERELGSTIEVLPLYGALETKAQDAVFRPTERRRVIVATNVAETSVTIPRVGGVVDSGVAKVLYHDSRRGMDRLERVRISRASADQRAGRAGRVGPGRCLRLWTEHTHEQLDATERPEIRRVDLAATLLQLRCWGERDLRTFGWLEAPAEHALEKAEQLARVLGAVDAGGTPTPLGRALSRMPLHPRLGTLVLVSAACGWLADGAAAAAVLSEGLGQRRGAMSGSSDVVAAIDGKRHDSMRHDGRAGAWLRRVTRQLERHAKAALEGVEDIWAMLPERVRGLPRPRAREAALEMAIWVGFADRLARRREAGSRRALMQGGVGVELSRESVVRTPELFVCVDVDDTRRGARAEALVRVASAVERAWLDDSTSREVEVRFDRALGRLTAVTRLCVGDLVLDERASPITDEVAAAKALSKAMRDDPVGMLGLERRRIVELRGRLARLARWMPELGVEPPSDARLVELASGSLVGMRTLSDLHALPLVEIMLGTQPPGTRGRLERELPTQLELPSGRVAPLTYEGEGPPVLAARIQELFGLTQTPTIAGGRVRVTLHLLAPNMRPQQITDDLASFWAHGYPQVRRELRGRYVKHAWPEDPLSAPPTRAGNRRR